MKTILTILLGASGVVNYIFINIAMLPCPVCEQKDATINYQWQELKKCNSDTCHKWCIKLQ